MKCNIHGASCLPPSLRRVRNVMRLFRFPGWRLPAGVCALLAAVALAGCAAPPVQEMSNARQALHSAQAAGASKLAPRIYAEAVHWLDDAEYALKHGNYSRARASAIRAEHAARAASLAARKAHPSPRATTSPSSATGP